MADWENISTYYAAIRSEGSGRVLVRACASPSSPTRSPTPTSAGWPGGLVHLGEPPLAARPPSCTHRCRGRQVRRLDELGSWWDQVTRQHSSLMTVHLTSSMRMGENRALTGADSYGRVWGYRNLRANDASLIPDAPGVNPQAAIMAIATRNCDQFLTEG